MRLCTLIGGIVLLGGQVALAQQAGDLEENHSGQEPAWNATSVGQVEPTPEMWFYEQYRQQYQDPQAVVREKAEFRAAQRQRRLAARRWFGLSNARPRANSDPFHGDYSARWTSNNGFYPSRWAGGSGGWVIPRAAD